MDLDTLFDAAMAGDAHATAKLEMKADTLFKYRETILHLQSKEGNAERVRFILREFPHKNLLPKLRRYKQTALHLAAYYGHTEVAEVLIDAARHLPPPPPSSDDDDNSVTSFQAFLRQVDIDKNTALHSAVMEKNLAIVKLLVEADPTDTHTQNREVRTPLYIAVERGLNDIAEIISTTCTAPSLLGPDGYTVVRIGNLEQAKSPGRSLYKIMDKDALYAAAIARDADAIAALEMHADKLNCYEETILHIESAAGKAEHVQFLLREFADKKLLVKLNWYKQTALHLASSRGHTQVAEILINAASHLPPPSPHDDNVDDDNPDLSFQAFLRQADYQMETALHGAVKKGSVALVKLLVEADPSDKHIQNHKGKTPMYIAVKKGLNGIADVISTTCIAPSLLGPHCSTVVRDKNFDQGGTLYKIMDKDALYAAAIARDADAIAALEMHADKLYYDEETILHTESENGKTEHVRFILREFADKSLLIKLNRYKQTALHLALSKGYTEAAEILINAARHLLPTDDVNAINSFQDFLRQADYEMETAIHIAIKKGNVGLVKLLVEADPSHTHKQCNSEGKTPIYIAVERGYYDMVKMICTTCTAPFDLDAPDGRTTVLHILINDTNPEKEEDRRDTIRQIVINNYGDEKLRNLIQLFLEGSDEQITETVINNYDYEKLGNLIHLFLERTDETKRCIILEVAVERNYPDIVELILAQLYAEIKVLNTIGFRTTARQRTPPSMYSLMSIKPLMYKVMDRGYTNMFNSLARIYEQYESWAIWIAYKVDIKLMLELISVISRRQEEHSMLEERHAEFLVTFVDNLGWTALHHAAYHEFDTIIHAIVEAQKKFQHPFVYLSMLSTPFHVAAAKGHTSTVICLMQSWPSWSSAYTNVDENEQNILHLAALQSKKELVQGILKYCSEEFKKEFVNKQDNNGDTPLHILIRRGCFIPELLTYQGLDIRVKNKEGWTALDMLYFDDQDIDNQVQIKIVLDGLHPSEDIFSNSVLPSKRMRKDKILNEQAKLKINQKYAALKGDTDAIATCFADAIGGDAISVAALKMKADKVNELGETILHVESKKGDIENVRFIVSVFANKILLGKLDLSKQTALHLAAQRGHIQVVEALIDAASGLLPSSSANDDAHNSVCSFQDFIRQANVPNLNTALHLAVLDRNVAMVKLLVEADPNDNHVRNNEGKTPIYLAAEKGHKDIIKAICTSCNALSLDGPGGRTTAFHALLQNLGQEGENNVIGTMVNAAKSWSSAQNTSVVGFEELFSRKDESERTILQLAVERNDASVVKLILQQDPANQPGAGETKRNSLMRLISKAIDNEYSADIVELLSETYISGIINHDPNDVLALILAIQKLEKGSVLRHLKDSKHLVNFKEDNGWTPLHYAVYHEFDAILDAIIKAQKEVGHPFVYGNSTTPFHVAVKYGYTSTLTRLMELWPVSSSASVDANSPYIVVDEKGRNILHLAAAAKNRKEMVKSILEYCPDKYKDTILEQQDINWDTPLHLLFSYGCFTPELIKHKGLNTMATNKKDLTPRDMLYVEDAIVEDQVHIKIALDHVQDDRAIWKFWGKRAENETDIWGCNRTPPSKRKKKDLKFEAEEKKLKQEKHDQRKNDLERYKNRTNTQILVTALITTVTFTVGFTMPGGLHQSGEVTEGLVVLSRKRAFNVFMLSDALALLMSTSSLFFYFLESMNEDPHQVSLLNASSTVLNILSIIGMMLTFIAGSYVVLSDTPFLALAVCIIGSLFFFLIFVWIIKMAYDRWVKEIKD